jgi:demethylmenaquinone methyltransferase/2-methoxy-6-polyprenyl-1,4-benzoquinol methylase
MAGLDESTKIPTEIKLHQKSRILEVSFEGGERFELSYEFLRVFTPSAEARGHGPGQEVLQVGKRDVAIDRVEAVGNYAIRPVFSDGHDSGLYSWDLLYNLGLNRDQLWQAYLDRLEKAHASRDSADCPCRPLRRRAWCLSQALILPDPFPCTDLMNERNTTHFGYQEVAEEEKARHVAEVFDSVAQRYDLMNDLMSGGLHRLWKAFAIAKSDVREGWRVLDVAGGTGDLALAFARKLGSRGQVWLTDINHAMLARGRDRLCDKGFIVPVAQCDAEKLPFPDDYFDCVTVAFGLRNMTHKHLALAEMQRVLRPGGRLLVLEFSQIWKPLAPAYDFYSFKVIPHLGQLHYA